MKELKEYISEGIETISEGSLFGYEVSCPMTIGNEVFNVTLKIRRP